MQNTTTKPLNKSLLVLSLTLTSGQSMAAGFQLNSQSATGLGRAFAGDAVIADNASIIARNAAGMALFDSSEFSMGLTAIDTEINIEDIYFNLGDDSGRGAVDDQTNSSTSFVPNIYYVKRIDDKWAIGFAEYTSFGTYHEFENDFGSEIAGASVFGGHTEIKSVNLSASVSYRVNEHWSVGGGIDLIVGQGILERDLVVDTQVGRRDRPISADVSVLDVDATAYGFGYNLGAVYEVNDDHRFGLAYRYSPDLDADGDMSYLGANLNSEELILPLPDTLIFSGFHQLTTKFAMHYSVQWTQWSEFDKLEITGDSFSKTYNWEDSMHYALGATYDINQTWTVRGGVMLDEAAQQTTTTISVPDSDREWYSAGFTYRTLEQSSIDFGFTYVKGEALDASESLVTGAPRAMTATSEANAMIYSIQYSRSF
ncbi:outer membrane protein transport protein [Thalassomonas sp. M1454]|uniref:outer membrane protein transport protein n=1 Tax=Thalassomonas sp. M1454 TaxID=2594477 RepID=UPI00117E7BDD|nr:outer membrane protein transport protein [Thalassomonas sp. M1454]TRX56672.1 aromatic hydrocarbon degradation protein [Thalassomonas sp. M1454]